MKSILSGLRVFLTVCLLAVLMFSTVVPGALAVPGKDQPVKAETPVAKEYERTAKETIDEGGLQSLEEVRDRSSGGGLNEVQGTVGKDEQKRPSNSGGSGAESIEQEIKEGLDKITGKG